MSSKIRFKGIGRGSVPPYAENVDLQYCTADDRMMHESLIADIKQITFHPLNMSWD